MDDKDFVRFLTGMRELNGIEPIDSLYRLNQIRRRETEGETKSLRFLQNRRDLVSPVVSKSFFLVEIISYCLNRNHFHFILRQLTDNGISKFMHKIGVSYTMYFNEKYNRSGSLFQGPFKAVHIKDTGYLCKLLVYVNYNHEIHNLGKAENWPWSSYLDVVGKRNGKLCNLDIIKEEFGSVEEFKKLAAEIIPEIQEEKELQKYLLE
jgi:REP element-mobilizing transposase RayT